YDMEAIYFEESVRNAKRQNLETRLLQLIQPAYHSVLGHLRSKTLDDFKDAFEKALKGGEAFAVAAHDCTQSFIAEFGKGCADVAIKQANWDATKVRDKLHRDIEAHVDSVRAAKLSEITATYEGKLNKALAEPVESLLDAASNETWPSIRNLLQRETKTAVSGFTGALSGFDINDSTLDEMVANLERYARSVVETKAREEAGRVLIRMKDRFATLFSRDSDSMPRVWTGKEDIRGITKAARTASLKLLSVMAVLRLEEDADSIENTLALALVDTNNKKVTSVDPLASSTWEEVSAEKTLITPVQCKSLWRQFKTETEYSVSQAIAAQEANKRNNNWMPPPWAILALVVLGFNEFMTLLRNPLWLLVIFVGFLLVKALWVQLDISGEFRNGALPGLLSLSTKFLPTVMNLLKKLAEEGQTPTAPAPQRQAPLESNYGDNSTQVNSDSASSNITSTENGIEHSSSLRQRQAQMN
ncbi:hypothetical protein MKW92_036994, partial [Papaver armeniacum]